MSNDAEDPRAKALAILTAMQSGDDNECAHVDADEALLELLRAIGYGDVAEAWEQACSRVTFWFA